MYLRLHLLVLHGRRPSCLACIPLPLWVAELTQPGGTDSLSKWGKPLLQIRSIPPKSTFKEIVPVASGPYSFLCVRTMLSRNLCKGDIRDVPLWIQHSLNNQTENQLMLMISELEPCPVTSFWLGEFLNEYFTY